MRVQFNSCEAKFFIEVQSGTIARQKGSECEGEVNEVIKARIEEYKMEDDETTAEHLGYLLPFIETSCTQKSSNKFHRSLTQHVYVRDTCGRSNTWTSLKKFISLNWKLAKTVLNGPSNLSLNEPRCVPNILFPLHGINTDFNINRKREVFVTHTVRMYTYVQLPGVNRMRIDYS